VPFKNRQEAGRRLAARVAEVPLERPVVYGVARGGVVVAAEVAAALSCLLEVLAPRKLPSPLSPEVAIGAVTQDGSVFLDDRAVEFYGVSGGYLARETRKAQDEVWRRLKTYREGRAAVEAAGVDAVVVDDGIATGYTLLAAVRGLRREHPASLVLAVPVAAQDSLERLRPEVDRVVCLETPVPFYAVGQAYADFSQVTDGEVRTLLRAHSPTGKAPTGPSGASRRPSD